MRFEKKIYFTIALLMLSIIGFGQCERIKRTVDKFTGDITLTSPVGMYMSVPAHIVKAITKDTIAYYLSMHTCGQTVSAGEKGVIILFEDGSRLSFENAEVESEVPVGNEYCRFKKTAFVELDKSSLNALKTKKMTDFRLYIYDSKPPNGAAKRLQEYVNCIMQMK